jgi:hypothetical protein
MDTGTRLALLIAAGTAVLGLLCGAPLVTGFAVVAGIAAYFEGRPT